MNNVSRYLRWTLILLTVISIVLVSLLVAASQNTAFFDKYYATLIGTNVVVTLFFLSLIIYVCMKMMTRARQRKFGTSLLRKFVIALVITGIVPGCMIFAVSVQFLYKSVDSWFDVRVERALDSGLTLSREVLENFQANLRQRAVHMSQEIAQTPSGNWVSVLGKLREREGYEEALLVNSLGTVIAVSGVTYSKIVPAAPSPRELQEALNRGYWQQLDDGNESGMLARVIVPVTREDVRPQTSNGIQLYKRGGFLFMSPAAREFSQSRDQLFLEITDRVPHSLASNAQMLMNGYRDYQEMVLTRDGLRSIYLMTLTLVLLLTMFGAMTVSGFIAGRMSRPLLDLLEGTRRVGEGRYEMVKESSSHDEIGELTRSFNTMTAQLASTRRDLENRGAELEQAKSYLERILSKMSSGVIVLDSNWCILSVNPSASRIMMTDLVSSLGAPLDDVLPAFYHEIQEQLKGHEHTDISMQSEIVIGSNNNLKRINVFTRGTDLQIGSRRGYLLVFDDISSLISAQRTEAWGEVARRLAHEIKNPLTPIRLAAERLQFKLSDKLEGRDHEILEKATHTIVDQVTAMKQMVDDFRTYAKLGAPKYERMDLPKFVRGVTALYEAANVHVELYCDAHVAAIEGDSNQLRQALHNLFSNAMEASPDPQNLIVRLYVRRVMFDEEDEGVELRFEDNGTGFSDKILEHAFEPYITTKSSGTGLGLPMIKKIAEEHGATVSVENIKDEGGNIRGAAISIIFRLLAENYGNQSELL